MISNYSQALSQLYPQIVTTKNQEGFDAEGNQVQYDFQTVIELAKKLDCKAQAKALLAASDWVILTDVPLDNKADYKTYRATLRDLVLNPVADPVFPDEPVPVWK